MAVKLLSQRHEVDIFGVRPHSIDLAPAVEREISESDIMETGLSQNRANSLQIDPGMLSQKFHSHGWWVGLRFSGIYSSSSEHREKLSANLEILN